MSVNQEILEEFYNKIKQQGYDARFIQSKHIKDLKHDIRELKEEIYSKLYEEYQSYFEFTPQVDFKPIRSLIVIAVPVPQFEIKYYHNSMEFSLIIPPTYLYGKKLIDDLEVELKNIFNPRGFHLNYAQLPVKTLAVRSGLAKYGRNNITYVAGMGSFHRLVPFYSDFPVEEDTWFDREMMDVCNKCKACVRNCPTKAISAERFLLRVDRCITYHNEQPGDIPFPSWIDKSWHNCLIGCMMCQIICPANKKIKNWIEPLASFNEEESEELLKNGGLDDLPEKLKQKLEKFDLTNYVELIPRNLRVLL